MLLKINQGAIMKIKEKSKPVRMAHAVCLLLQLIKKIKKK
jgi:hypothetical protein